MTRRIAKKINRNIDAMFAAAFAEDLSGYRPGVARMARRILRKRRTWNGRLFWQRWLNVSLWRRWR
jgi:hypothetical protein